MGIIEEAPVHNGLVYAFKNSAYSVERRPVGREIFYRRKNQEIINATYRVLIAHKHSLPDEKYIDSFIDYLDEANKFSEDIKNKGPIRYRNWEDRIDYLIEATSCFFEPFIIQ